MPRKRSNILNSEQIERLRRIRGLKCGNSRIDDQDIQQMASKAEFYLDRAYHHPYNPYFACNLSIRLESDAFELHAHRSLVFADKGLQDLFHNLAEDETEHISRLQSLYRAYFDEELDLSSPKNKNSFLKAKQQPCLFTT